MKFGFAENCTPNQTKKFKGISFFKKETNQLTFYILFLLQSQSTIQQIK